MTGFYDGHFSDEPEFWQAIGERLDFNEPDPNKPIKDALATEAFVRAALDDKDATVLVRKPDGTVTEEPRGEQ